MVGENALEPMAGRAWALPWQPRPAAGPEPGPAGGAYTISTAMVRSGGHLALQACRGCGLRRERSVAHGQGQGWRRPQPELTMPPGSGRLREGAARDCCGVPGERLGLETPGFLSPATCRAPFPGVPRTPCPCTRRLSSPRGDFSQSVESACAARDRSPRNSLRPIRADESCSSWAPGSTTTSSSTPHHS